MIECNAAKDEQHYKTDVEPFVVPNRVIRNEMLKILVNKNTGIWYYNKEQDLLDW